MVHIADIQQTTRHSFGDLHRKEGAEVLRGLDQDADARTPDSGVERPEGERQRDHHVLQRQNQRQRLLLPRRTHAWHRPIPDLRLPRDTPLIRIVLPPCVVHHYPQVGTSTPLVNLTDLSD
ncbi:hypothetical protein [Nocardia sp. NBC_01388]|uniref:hypothetical protein n=1 Tax=Nocardia sp. NBC_01388 TaxID=2903596 RepID=UPI003244A001